ncbi:MAG: hypothetical protein ABI607_11895 [Betaproteobacteria bacterium]
MTSSLRTRIIVTALAMFAGAGLLGLVFTLFAPFAPLRALGMLSVAGAATGVGLQMLLLRSTDPAALTGLTAWWRDWSARISGGVVSSRRSVYYRAQ